MRKCPFCKGEGVIYMSCCGDELDFHNCEIEMCPTCHEWCSMDDGDTCESCDGTGYIDDPNDLYDQERERQDELELEKLNEHDTSYQEME